MLGFLIAAYLQFVIMLAELKKGLCMEKKRLCSKATTVLSEWALPKMYDASLFKF